MNRIALITGATSGIGKAIALKLAKESYDIIITGRRKERLEELKVKLTKANNIRVLILNFDIRIYNDVEKSFSNLPKEWQDIDVLVNNAGLAVGLNPIHQGVIDDWERMIDTNIKGLLYMTRLVSPGMADRKNGHIINICSIAGKDVYANGNVYCATKHAVDALSKGIRIDLLPYGIKVTQICPGAVETEFSLVRFKGDGNRAKEVYKGFTPLYANDIAEAVYYAVSQPKHIDIQDVLIMPTAQADGSTFHKEE